MTTINVALSVPSISAAANKVRAFAGRVNNGVDDTVATLASLGKAVATSAVSVETGELASRIKVERVSQGHYQLAADSPYAAFHEFGTGVVGHSTFFYPYCDVPWAYDAGWTPEAHTPDGGWFYEDPKDSGKWHWTRGQRGTNFMGRAGEAMRQEARAIAKAAV